MAFLRSPKGMTPGDAEGDFWRPWSIASGPCAHPARATATLSSALRGASEPREGNLTRARYHRLSVIQRFNVLCNRARSGSDAIILRSPRGTPLRRNSVISTYLLDSMPVISPIGRAGGEARCQMLALVLEVYGAFSVLSLIAFLNLASVAKLRST